MSTQKITVLGAGNIGSRLGRKWITAGHQVPFGGSDPNSEKAQTLRSELGNGNEIGTVAQALSTIPDAVLMAIPGTAMDAIISQYAEQLDGKIISNIPPALIFTVPSTHTVGKISLIQTMRRVLRISSSVGPRVNHA